MISRWHKLIVSIFVVAVLLTGIVLGDIKTYEDIRLLGDEKSVYWYNGTYTWGEKASGSMAGSYIIIKPPNIGSTGQQLTTTVSGNTCTLSWEASGGVGGIGDIDDVGDAASGSAFTDDGPGNTLYFEGSTADGVETLLTAVDPTAIDKTITFPNATGYTVLDGTVCTDIEGTGLAIGGAVLNWSAASTDLTDTADLLYEAELDTFSELQTQIADKTLVNEEDAISSLNIDGGTIDGATIGATSETTGKFTTLTLTDSAQDYKWLDAGGRLGLQGQTSDAFSGLGFFAQDGDGEDNVIFQIYGRGTPATASTDYERLAIKWDQVNDIYSILVQEAESNGVAMELRPLALGMSNTHLVLDTGGNSSFGGNLGVTGTITPTGQIKAIDGTEIAPGIAFSGGTNTGIRRVSTGSTLRLVVLGGDRLTLSSAVADFEVALRATSTNTSALLIEQAGGTDIFNVDTTNSLATLNANLRIATTKSILFSEFGGSTYRHALALGDAGGAVGGSSLVGLRNRQLNGEVAIMANAAAGQAGEVEVARFTDTAITLDENTDITGTINTTSDDNWDLNDYTATGDYAAEGYVTVTINGTEYQLLAKPAP